MDWRSRRHRQTVRLDARTGRSRCASRATTATSVEERTTSRERAALLSEPAAGSNRARRSRSGPGPRRPTTPPPRHRCDSHSHRRRRPPPPTVDVTTDPELEPGAEIYEYPAQPCNLEITAKHSPYVVEMNVVAPGGKRNSVFLREEVRHLGRLDPFDSKTLILTRNGVDDSFTFKERKRAGEDPRTGPGPRGPHWRAGGEITGR